MAMRRGNEERLLCRGQSGACPDEKARKVGIARAAWQLEDAVAGRVLEEYPLELQAREQHLKLTKWEVYYNRALIGMILLSIFELPPWCRPDLRAGGFFVSGEEACYFKGEVLLSGVMYLQPSVGLFLEVCLVAVIAMKTWKMHKQAAYFPGQEEEHFKIKLAFAMVMLELLDCAVFAVWRPSFRLAFIPRTAYLCLLPAVGELFYCVKAVLKEILSVAAFLVGVMLFYAWIGVTVLKGADEDVKEFARFGSSLNSVFVAGVSDDFVDVLKQSYKTYRGLGALWLSFLFLVHVLLLSLVLDTLVSAYMTFSEEHNEKVAQDTVKGMKKAFEMLSHSTNGGGQEVDQDAFVQFIEEYSRSHRVSAISPRVAEAAFKAADKDASGQIEAEEFCSFFCVAMQYKLTSTRTYSKFKDLYPQTWKNLAKFREYIEGNPEDGLVPGFDLLMNKVLILNFTLMIIESYWDLNQIPEPPWCDYLEMIFSIIYLLQIMLKLSVFSWAEYMADASNMFDCFTTTVLLLTSCLQEIFGRQLARYANMLRLFRLLRVIRNLKNLPQVQFMADVIMQLVVASKDMMTLLGVVVFFFTMLSVQLFGGLLRENDERLHESEYLEKGMLVLNCNDVLMAFGVWVVMLLQEYQPNFPDATARVEVVPGSWLLFPIFYVAGVSITFELVKAFTIEVFITLKKEADEARHHNKKSGHTKEIDELFEQLEVALKREGETLHQTLKGNIESYNTTIKVLEEEEEEEEAHGHGHGGHGHHGDGHHGDGHHGDGHHREVSKGS